MFKSSLYCVIQLSDSGYEWFDRLNVLFLEVKLDLTSQTELYIDQLKTSHSMLLSVAD